MESRMEELILNHNVAISRIEDCEDNMQVCKGDINVIKIEQASMGKDICMLEGARVEPRRIWRILQVVSTHGLRTTGRQSPFARLMRGPWDPRSRGFKGRPVVSSRDFSGSLRR
jgi:hypothetical protein